MLLHSGYNIIQLTAKDKFGREVLETLEVVYTGAKQEMIELEIPIEIDIEGATTSTSTEAL